MKTRKNEKLTVMKLQPQNKTNDPLLNWSSDHASCQVHAKSKDTHLASMSCKTLPYMLVTHRSPAKGNSQLSKFQTSSMHMLRSSPTTFVIDPKCLIYDQPRARATAACSSWFSLRSPRKPSSYDKAIFNSLSPFSVSTGSWSIMGSTSAV